MALNTLQQQLISELFSESESTVIKAIEQLKTEGSEEVLVPLFNLLISTNNGLIKEEVIKLLNNVKNNNSVNLFIEAISNPKYNIYKPELIAACWENGLDFSGHLSFFVDLVLNEDYLVAIEAITVIETFNPPFNNEEINLNISKLEKAYMAADPMKQPMIKSLAKLLNDMLSML